MDPTATVADLGERALIERIRARVPAPPEWVEVGIGDDAAVVAPDRNTFDVVTTDALIEGVHFDRAFVPPRAIGHRALAANLSDLASMGARPRAALLSLALPGALQLGDFDAILDGVLALAERCKVTLVGGNIARSPGPLFVDVTALGSAGRRHILRREGARPGDVMYVSGQVGAAAAGLEWCRAHPGEALKLNARDPAFLSAEASANAGLSAEALAEAGLHADRMRGAIARFLYPDPRVRLGWVLARNRAATACVDLSDGLADGVRQLAAASGVGAIVEGDLVPVADAVGDWFRRAGRDPLLAAATGGEDYELLFTVPARRHRVLEEVARQVGRGRRREDARTNVGSAGGLPLARIGVITRGSRVVLRRDGGDEALPEGFTHFR